MTYLIDTGPLVAALRRPQDRDPFTPWAASLLRSLRQPLFTCDAVLTEAAHFLGSPARLLEAVQRGLLISKLDTQAAAPRLLQLVEKYASRPMDFADACLVYLSEGIRDCKIITIDREDFTIYRRHGREVIPLRLPD